VGRGINNNLLYGNNGLTQFQAINSDALEIIDHLFKQEKTLPFKDVHAAYQKLIQDPGLNEYEKKILNKKMIAAIAKPLLPELPLGEQYQTADQDQKIVNHPLFTESILKYLQLINQLPENSKTVSDPATYWWLAASQEDLDSRLFFSNYYPYLFTPQALPYLREHAYRLTGGEQSELLVSSKQLLSDRPPEVSLIQKQLFKDNQQGAINNAFANAVVDDYLVNAGLLIMQLEPEYKHKHKLFVKFTQAQSSICTHLLDKQNNNQTYCQRQVPAQHIIEDYRSYLEYPCPECKHQDTTSSSFLIKQIKHLISAASDKPIPKLDNSLANIRDIQNYFPSFPANAKDLDKLLNETPLIERSIVDCLAEVLENDKDKQARALQIIAGAKSKSSAIASQSRSKVAKSGSSTSSEFAYISETEFTKLAFPEKDDCRTLAEVLFSSFSNKNNNTINELFFARIQQRIESLTKHQSNDKSSLFSLKHLKSSLEHRKA
jgi:hypothetical protein